MEAYKDKVLKPSTIKKWHKLYSEDISKLAEVAKMLAGDYSNHSLRQIWILWTQSLRKAFISLYLGSRVSEDDAPPNSHWKSKYMADPINMGAVHAQKWIIESMSEASEGLF